MKNAKNSNKMLLNTQSLSIYRKYQHWTLSHSHTCTVNNSESKTGDNVLQFVFIERLPKSLCGLSIEPTVFFRISIFCALYSRICEPRFVFSLVGSLASNSVLSQAYIVACDFVDALEPSPNDITDTTSGAGFILNSIAPDNDVALPFNGFAYRRKFSSFCKLFDFSSSCRGISMFGDKFTPEPEVSKSRRRHVNAPRAPIISAAIAVIQMMAIKKPDLFWSFEMRAVSTCGRKIYWILYFIANKPSHLLIIP